MTVAHNPKVPLDGLVLYLDATSSRSYPGTGGTWLDISGRGNHYSMNGTVPLITESKFKYWDFGGNNNGDATPRSFNAPLGFNAPGSMDSMGMTRTGSFTISFWFRYDGSESVSQTGIFTNAGSADGFRFGPASGGYYWLMGPGYREGVSYTNANSGDNNWHLGVGVFDRANQYGRSGGASVHLYQDGNYLGDVGDFSAQTIMQATGPGVVRHPCCLRYAGQVATITWHNKALSASEVDQLYLALSARFQ